MNLIKKIDYNAPVVLSFAIASFVVLCLGGLTGGKSTQLLFCVYRSSLLDPLTYLRLFLHVLGHANMEHYVNNMMMILLVGPMLEEKYGSQTILILMVITAFVTGIINTAFFTSGLLGASGIVFMMIILSSITSVKNGKIPLTLIVVVILYLGGQIAEGLLAKDNISQLTHIIGGICGGFFGLLINKKNR